MLRVSRGGVTGKRKDDMSSGVLKHGQGRIPVVNGNSHAEENNRLMVVIATLLFVSLVIAVIAIFVYVIQLATSVTSTTAAYSHSTSSVSITQKETH